MDHELHVYDDPTRRPSDLGKPESRWGSVTGQKRLAQAGRRRNNDKRIIENPLAHYTDEELVADASQFHAQHLRTVNVDRLVRAARVAKDIRVYDQIARSENPNAGNHLAVQLSLEERRALKRERDVAISERGMYIVILTVSLAAFLQGHVQSSINGASIFREVFDLGADPSSSNAGSNPPVTVDDWKLGAANASPFLFAAVAGCPLSLPINDLVGRRGAMAIASILILGSSIGAAFCREWYTLFSVRIINGLGMGIKAVSTPILASETAVGYWRGTSILAWQLWVAFGIMMGFVFNLIFLQASSKDTTVSLILGAPCVPALVLLVGLWFCPESPRYYMRRGSSIYNPEKAYRILLRLRNTELQALRDLYLVYKSLEIEDYAPPDGIAHIIRPRLSALLHRLKEYFSMYRQLFQERRLRNALISSSTVALAQQLCGINVMAFYSGNLFQNGGASALLAMEYSFGYGAVNFFFGLPAIRTIDTLGRRKWLIMTLPAMALCMMAAALSFQIDVEHIKIGIVAMWLFLFAAAYSPGLGPIPFTLASESFPLSHREAGCAFAIAVNLGFAGILSITFPRIIAALGNGGTLGLFSGLNILAFSLIFLLVEETKRRSLEDLDLVFAVPKRAFVRFQVLVYLPWFLRHHFGRLCCCVRRRHSADADEMKPNLYIDTMWGPDTSDVLEVEHVPDPGPMSSLRPAHSPYNATGVGSSASPPTWGLFAPGSYPSAAHEAPMATAVSFGATAAPTSSAAPAAPAAVPAVLAAAHVARPMPSHTREDHRGPLGRGTSHEEESDRASSIHD